MHDALEQLKILFKIFQLIVIDLDSRMQALHLYFICQTDMEFLDFIFERDENRYADERSIFFSEFMNEIDHNWLKLALSQPQMNKNQSQMDKSEFSSLQLPVGWTSVCLGFIALRPYIAIIYRFTLI